MVPKKLIVGAKEFCSNSEQVKYTGADCSSSTMLGILAVTVVVHRGEGKEKGPGAILRHTAQLKARLSQMPKGDTKPEQRGRGSLEFLIIQNFTLI